MKILFFQIVIVCLLFISGCSSSSPDVNSQSGDVVQATHQEEPPAEQPETQAPPATTQTAVRIWAPKFIKTGLASGIMIEFTRIKKDKQLNARYAGIELRKYPPSLDTVIGSEVELTLNQKGTDYMPAPFDLDRTNPLLLTTTINDVKQAFFRVAPGKYVLRQTKVWADQSYIGDVVVREGSYSVITIPVRIPGEGQP